MILFDSFFVQIYSSLLVYYLLVLDADTRKIWGDGGIVWGGQTVRIEHDYYFKSDNVDLILGYSPIVMSMSSSYAYSLCVNRYWGTMMGDQSCIQESFHI